MILRMRQILLFFLLAAAFAVPAQKFDASKVCRMKDGRLTFTLEQKWTPAQRRELCRVFSLDSAVVAAAYQLKAVISDSGTVWFATRLDANRIELSKEPARPSAGSGDPDRIFLIDDQWISFTTGADRESVPYGVNRLTRNTIVQLGDGRLRFFLPGRKDARKVCLSGSFNAWSTLETPMARTDSGWNVTIRLLPGRYAYKFVVDGKWANDAFNKLTEDDLCGGRNNVFYCYNYKFTLAGYPTARKVTVTGSFNDWNPDGLQMIRFRNTWVLPLFLREGTHAYKFIVDGDWITDPANKVTRPDGKGNKNSFMAIGDTMVFRLKGYASAKHVVVSGDFNAWNGEELSMSRTRDGWELPYVLAPGNYQYKFVVDGTWIADPADPYFAAEQAWPNSFLAVKPNYWFRLDGHSDADKVCLAGDFNGWRKNDWRMALRDGTWWFPVYLKPGKYTYKFVVDGKWITDPGNALWEENQYGTGNSVLWISP